MNRLWISRVTRRVLRPLGWGALLLQLGLTMALVRSQGRSASSGIVRFFSYFTVVCCAAQSPTGTHTRSWTCASSATPRCC